MNKQQTVLTLISACRYIYDITHHFTLQLVDVEAAPSTTNLGLGRSWEGGGRQVAGVRIGGGGLGRCVLHVCALSPPYYCTVHTV